MRSHQKAKSLLRAYFVVFLLLLSFGSFCFAVAALLPRTAAALTILCTALLCAAWGVYRHHRSYSETNGLLSALPTDVLRDIDASEPSGRAGTILNCPPEEQLRQMIHAYVKKSHEFDVFSVERFLLRLLRDESHTHVIENLDKRLESVLQSSAFGYRWSVYCIVYVQFEDYSAYMLKNCNGHLRLGDFRKMYDVVDNAFTQALGKRNIVHGVEMKNSCVFLVNLEGTDADTPTVQVEKQIDGIGQICEETVRIVYETFNVSLETAVSTPFRDITETHTIFEWVTTMKDYCDFIAGAQPCRGPKQFEQLIAPPHAGPPSVEKIYYSSLLAEDFVRAESALLDLEHYVISNKTIQVPRLKSIMIQCLGAAEDISTSNTGSGESISATDWREEIQKCVTLEELNGQIHAFFLFLTDRSTARQMECSSTAQRIRDYLDKHYMSPELTLTLVSDALSISPSYITRIFKKELGCTVPDYIHARRIARAKELLLDTDLSINDIAEQVGYSTTWTMNRTFKQHTQMTPGTWRQNAKNSKELLSQ